jgi:hypothetical protein
MNISLAKVHIEHLVAYIYKESKLCKDWKFAPYIPHETILKKKVRHKCLLCLGWFFKLLLTLCTTSLHLKDGTHGIFISQLVMVFEDFNISFTTKF